MLFFTLRKWLAPLLLVSSSFVVTEATASIDTLRTQGEWYGYWGWNRANYSNSDIHFKGDDHDFILYDVKATDRQTEVNLHNLVTRYFNPMQLTIPQYNWRFGYFVADNWSVSLGFDHMKYVMVQNQTVDMTGTISREGYEQPDPSKRRQRLVEEFLTYEHTDGFNMIAVETERFLPIWSWTNTKNDTKDLALFIGGGGGILFPKSNVMLLGDERNDQWHVAGHAWSVKTGFEANLWKGLFFRFIAKFGYANMDDVLTSSQGDKADQTFYFNEYIGAMGYRF